MFGSRIGDRGGHHHKVKVRFEIGIVEVVNLPKELEGQEIYLQWVRSHKKPDQHGETSRAIAVKNPLASGSSSSATATASFPSTERVVLDSRFSFDPSVPGGKFEKKELKFTLLAHKPSSSGSGTAAKKKSKLLSLVSGSSSSAAGGTTTVGSAKIDLAEFAQNGTSTTKFVPLGKKSPPSLVLSFHTKWLKINNKTFVEGPAPQAQSGKLGTGQTLNLLGMDYHLKTSDTISEADTSVGDLSDDEEEDVFAAGDSEHHPLHRNRSQTSAAAITTPAPAPAPEETTPAVAPPAASAVSKLKSATWTTASLPSAAVVANINAPVPAPAHASATVPSIEVSAPSNNAPSTSFGWQASRPARSPTTVTEPAVAANAGEVEKLKSKIAELELRLEASKQSFNKKIETLEAEKAKLASELSEGQQHSKGADDSSEKESLRSRLAHTNSELLDLRYQLDKAGTLLEEETILRTKLEKQVEELMEEMERTKASLKETTETKDKAQEDTTVEHERLKASLAMAIDARAKLERQVEDLLAEQERTNAALKEERERREKEAEAHLDEIAKVNNLLAEEAQLRGKLESQATETMEELERLKRASRPEEVVARESTDGASEGDETRARFEREVQDLLAEKERLSVALKEERENREKENEAHLDEIAKAKNALAEEAQLRGKLELQVTETMEELERAQKANREIQQKDHEGVAEDIAALLEEERDRSTQLAKRLENATAELETVQTELRQLKEQHATVQSKTEESPKETDNNSEASVLRDEIESLKKALEEEKNMREKEKEKWEKRIKALQEEDAEKQKTREQHLQELREALKTKLREESTLRQELESQVRFLSDELERTRALVAELQEQATKAPTTDASVGATDSEETKARVQALETELQDALKALVAARQEQQETANQLKELEQSLKKTESSLKKYRKRASSHEEQTESLRQRLTQEELAKVDAETRLDALKDNVVALKEQLRAAQSERHQEATPEAEAPGGSKEFSIAALLQAVPPQLAGLVLLCLILSHLLAFQLG